MNNYFEEIGLWPRRSGNGIVRAYAIGFVLSFALTLFAFWFATTGAFPYDVALVTLLFLALVQFAVQVVCFLHLGEKDSSGERLFILAGACLVVLILVAGSVWIMFTLQGRMMPDQDQMQQYMDDQAGL